MAVEINAMGKACPMPVVMAKQALDGGDHDVTVLVDNQIAVENLKRLAGNQGFAYAVREEGGAYAVDFSRGEDCPACDAVINSPIAPPGAGWAVFVGRDTIGEGDRELGTNLMRMFFYTLAQGEDKPAAILFMNGGVKLPTQDQQVAEHLKALTEAGVEVLVCGTCLNFYHLADQLQVGTVSNMYDIVSRMQQAGKVISL